MESRGGNSGGAAADSKHAAGGSGRSGRGGGHHECWHCKKWSITMKCNGCYRAHFCDRICFEKAWMYGSHKEWCEGKHCFLTSCDAAGATLVCTICQKAVYCNEGCQQQDIDFHQKQCNRWRKSIEKLHDAWADADRLKLVLCNKPIYPNATLSGDASNQTVLFKAALSGHVEAVALLLEHNADPNKATARGSTPLSKAIKKGHTAIADMLRAAGAT